MSRDRTTLRNSVVAAQDGALEWAIIGLYEIDDSRKSVKVYRIAHRKEVYR
jgi:hypothetical protein